MIQWEEILNMYNHFDHQSDSKPLYLYPPKKLEASRWVIFTPSEASS